MNKLSFALGLTAMFAIATSAQAAPKDFPWCITYLEPANNLTKCEYRKPATVQMGTSSFAGSTPLRAGPFEGQDRNQCDAFFKEKEKAFGKCNRNPKW